MTRRMNLESSTENDSRRSDCQNLKNIILNLKNNINVDISSIDEISSSLESICSKELDLETVRFTDTENEKSWPKLTSNVPENQNDFKFISDDEKQVQNAIQLKQNGKLLEELIFDTKSRMSESPCGRDSSNLEAETSFNSMGSNYSQLKNRSTSSGSIKVDYRINGENNRRCKFCKVRSSSFWYANAKNEYLCNSCGFYRKFKRENKSSQKKVSDLMFNGDSSASNEKQQTCNESDTPVSQSHENRQEVNTQPMKTNKILKKLVGNCECFNCNGIDPEVVNLMKKVQKDLNSFSGGSNKKQQTDEKYHKEIDLQRELQKDISCSCRNTPKAKSTKNSSKISKLRIFNKNNEESFRKWVKDYQKYMKVSEKVSDENLLQKRLVDYVQEGLLKEYIRELSLETYSWYKFKSALLKFFRTIDQAKSERRKNIDENDSEEVCSCSKIKHDTNECENHLILIEAILKEYLFCDEDEDEDEEESLFDYKFYLALLFTLVLALIILFDYFFKK